MNKYQYKELNHAEIILKSGFTTKHIASELKVLAKYFNYQGFDEIKIKESLQEFCKNNLAGYNQAIHFNIINNAVKYGIYKKNKLIQINEIEITKNELETIGNMDILYDYKRVIFTLLVLTKLSRKFNLLKDGEIKSDEYFFGGHKNYRELVSTSKVTFNKTKKSDIKNIHDLIHLLDEKGIVKITNNGNIKLLFMYEIEEDNNVVFSVNDYTVIGYFYDLHYGENRVKECENCGVPIKVNGKNHKYCTECSELINKEQVRKRVQKHRSNNM